MQSSKNAKGLTSETISRNKYKNNIDELLRFENDAWEYINRILYTKSIKELCKHLGITDKTLSKYKMRNLYWRECINDIKAEIGAYNRFAVLGGINYIIVCYLKHTPELLKKCLLENYKNKPKELMDPEIKKELLYLINNPKDREKFLKDIEQ